MVQLTFLIAALTLFVLAAAGVPAGRFNLAAAGLACLVAALVADGFHL